ncbi:hypothetical protein [Kitasatospora sp. LaBMicrA B282]|uniref:hypothetical protein n=1 Tax=Kitasatospora sp. LaBMicrA B282 TaxID=3420949 RepID=UPI003D11ADDF
MSVYRSDLDLSVFDVADEEREVDVALNLIDGTVRLSILWTHEIYLTPDDAERVARSLLEAAASGRETAEEFARRVAARESGGAVPGPSRGGQG